MKLIKLQELKNYPKGTLYRIYESCVFSKLQVFYEPILDSNNFMIDWFYYDLLNPSNNNELSFKEVCEKLEKEESLKVDYFDAIERDGMYDNNRMILIYDKEDIKDIIQTFSKLLNYEI